MGPIWDHIKLLYIARLMASCFLSFLGIIHVEQPPGDDWQGDASVFLCRLNLDLCFIRGTLTMTQTPTAWSSSVYVMTSSQISVRKQEDREGHIW